MAMAKTMPHLARFLATLTGATPRLLIGIMAEESAAASCTGSTSRANSGVRAPSLQVHHGARQCARDPLELLDPSHDELGQLVEVVGFRQDDHVVGAGHSLGRPYSRHAGDVVRHPSWPAGMGLDQDVLADQCRI